MEPPKEFLEAIGFEDVWMRTAFPALDFDAAYSRGWEFYVPSILNGLLSFFRIRKEDDGQKYYETSQFLGEVFFEAVQNAVRHGNRFQGEIEIGWWLGEQGIVCGIKDQGDFFRNPVNAAKAESRIILEHTGKYGCGGGMEVIYQADGIKVVEGVLYLMVLKITIDAGMPRMRKEV